MASERLPFHDDDSCLVGQALKASGEWQNYEPQRIVETRFRCPLCAKLGAAYPLLSPKLDCHHRAGTVGR